MDDDVTVADQGLRRLDVNPTLRIPFTRWQFLTINSSVIVARHVLDREPRRFTRPDPRRDRTVLLRFPVAHHRPGVQPDLEHARERLRGEVQARHRADAGDSTGHGGRSVRPDRRARRPRLRRRQRDPLYLQPRQPGLREEGKQPRDHQRRALAELLHRRAGRAVRPLLPIQSTTATARTSPRWR